MANNKFLEFFLNDTKHSLKILSITKNKVTTIQDCYFYSGEHKNGKAHGTGIVELNSSVFRDGQWKHGHFVSGSVFGSGSDKDKILYVGEFKNGLKHGLQCTEYCENNVVKYIGGFKKGKKNGQGVVRDCDTDKEIYHGSFKNGKGIEFFHHSDGRIKYEGYFKNNEANGAGKEYYKNGNVSFEGRYRNGEYYGKGKQYGRDKKLLFIGTFFNNYLKKGTMFKENKKITGMFHFGRKQHICSIFDSNNRLECKGNFTNDKKDGVVSIYHPNGKLQFKGYFSNDVKDGPGKEYNEQGKLVRNGYWENNVFKRSDSQNQKKIRENENKIKYFMQTNQNSYLEKVKSADIIAYLKKTANKTVKGTKPKLVKQLQKWRKQIKEVPIVQDGEDMVYNVYLMENVPIDEFLKEDDAIVLINEQGKHFSHVLPQHEIMYICEDDRSWRSYVNNSSVKAMIRMTTEGGNYYFLRSDSILKDMKKGYNVFHFKTQPENVRILSKNVALGGSIVSGVHCDQKDVVKVSKVTKKEKRANGLKMTVKIEF